MLAGLSEVALIQEPIASAIAAGWRADAEGLWLVYNLGGGTLDVSLLETRLPAGGLQIEPESTIYRESLLSCRGET